MDHTKTSADKPQEPSKDSDDLTSSKTSTNKSSLNLKTVYSERLGNRDEESVYSERLGNRDEESLVAAQSMTSLANGSNAEVPSATERSPGCLSQETEACVQEKERDSPKILYREDPTGQDLSGESVPSPQEIPEPPHAPTEIGRKWSSEGLPIEVVQSEPHWKSHPPSYNSYPSNALPPASSLLKVPRMYDSNMNLQHNGGSYPNSGSGAMPTFPNTLGQPIQTIPTPTRMGVHYETPPMPMTDPHLSYQGQMMNHPEYYIMPDNGAAILPSGPGNPVHIFNNFPPGDPHSYPAANVEIPESVGQYQEPTNPRRTRSSKVKSPHDYFNVVKNYVYGPREEYIVAAQDMYGKPEDKDNFYMAISPEINPAEVRSIDHKGLVSKYIDYLLIENEHITEMSKSVSIPIENCVMDDPYLMDIVRVKIPFPTPKYLQWLSAYYPSIQVDWPAIRKELATFNGVGGRKPKRTYFMDRRPCHILLGESFYFFQREKDKQVK